MKETEDCTITRSLAIIVSMKIFRLGKVEHAANITFGLEKSKSFFFFCFKKWYTALSPFG